MKLILLSCSGKKAPGGSSEQPPSRLADLLSPASFKSLMRARKELVSLLQSGEAQNLGFDPAGVNRFQPAFQRYQGFVYLYSDFYHLYPHFNGRVLIISAMYGLLDGGDYLRNYNLRLGDPLPGGLRVDIFWKQHGLRDLLLECVRSSGAAEVHDLLPEKYRSLLSPWAEPDLPRFKAYTFPAPGQGTGYERALCLKSLLSN